jgi:hypothetical protein
MISTLAVLLLQSLAPGPASAAAAPPPAPLSSAGTPRGAQGRPRPFAAASLVERIGATIRGGVTCTRAVDDRPPRAVRCPRRDAAALLHIVRMERAAPEQTIVTTFTPGGEAEPAVHGKYGAMFRDSEAALAIAADGSILECRVVRNKALGLVRGTTLSSPCRDYAPGRLLFEPAAQAGPPRTMTIRIRGYYRG